MVVVDRRRSDHRCIANPVSVGRELRVAHEESTVARLLKRNARLVPAVGSQDQLIETIHAAADGEMVAVAGDAGQIDPLRPRDHRLPLLGTGRISNGQTEVHMIVVGVDPEFSVRSVDMIFATVLARRDQRQRLRRILGGNEANFRRRIVAGRNEQRAAVVRPADPDRETELLRFLVKRDVLARRPSKPVIARPIAAPIVVHLGEGDAGAVA